MDAAQFNLIYQEGVINPLTNQGFKKKGNNLILIENDSTLALL